MNLRLLSTFDLAYLAGIIDGEGSINIRKVRRWKTTNTHQYCLQLYVSTTSLKLGSWLEHKLGLKLYMWNLPSTRRNPHLRVSLTLSLTGERAYDMLKEVLPYLVMKQEHARLGIEFCDIKGFNQGTRPSVSMLEVLDDMHQRMSDLNHSDFIIPKGGG